jgi:hypothetical protein
VRKHMGYLRYDTEAARLAVNAVYADLRLLQNLFLPSVKLQAKESARARRAQNSARPLVLVARIEEKLERVYALAAPRGSQTVTRVGGEQTGFKTAPLCSPPPLKIKTPRPLVTAFMARRSAVG